MRKKLAITITGLVGLALLSTFAQTIWAQSSPDTEETGEATPPPRVLFNSYSRHDVNGAGNRFVSASASLVFEYATGVKVVIGDPDKDGRADHISVTTPGGLYTSADEQLPAEVQSFMDQHAAKLPQVNTFVMPHVQRFVELARQNSTQPIHKTESGQSYQELTLTDSATGLKYIARDFSDHRSVETFYVITQDQKPEYEWDNPNTPKYKDVYLIAIDERLPTTAAQWLQEALENLSPLFE